MTSAIKTKLRSLGGSSLSQSGQEMKFEHLRSRTFSSDLVIDYNTLNTVFVIFSPKCLQ